MTEITKPGGIPMKTSLISVTFRKKSLEEVVDLAVQGGLDAIEWGGDVHVPPTDPAAADKALQLCRDKGLAISAYGSYYRCNDSEDFAPILNIALRLQTKVIRVWAGGVFDPSSNCTEEHRAGIVAKLRKAVAMAAEHGCILATEYHANTLTDCQESALRLASEVPGLYTYWQPASRKSREENISNILGLGKLIKNVHMYHRNPSNQRMPLAVGAEDWKAYLAALRDHTDTGYVGLEFVAEDSVEQYLEDCKTLHALMNGL